MRAASAGTLNTPPPTTALMTSATMLQRPMARTSVRSGLGDTRGDCNECKIKN